MAVCPVFCMRSFSGFTLQELLAVIAVVGVLMSLLFPALSKARSLAMEKKCSSNLRTWGQLFHIYAAEHNGLLPHTDDRSRNSTPGAYDSKYPEHEYCYVDVLPPLIHQKAWRDYPKGEKPTDGIWQCPAAKPLPDSAYSYSPSQEGYHSYAMNSYLEQDFKYGLPWKVSPQPSYLRLSRCTRMSQTILMFEQTLKPDQGYNQKGGLREAGRHTAEDPRAATERHSHTRDGLGGNVLYLDGHGEWRNDLYDDTLKNPRVPDRGDLTWYPYYY